MTTKERNLTQTKEVYSIKKAGRKAVKRYSFLGKEVHSSSATVPDKIYESEGVDNEITGNSLKARSR